MDYSVNVHKIQPLSKNIKQNFNEQNRTKIKEMETDFEKAQKRRPISIVQGSTYIALVICTCA